MLASPILTPFAVVLSELARCRSAYVGGRGGGWPGEQARSSGVARCSCSP